MVLCLKARESRSLPGLQNAKLIILINTTKARQRPVIRRAALKAAICCFRTTDHPGAKLGKYGNVERYFASGKNRQQRPNGRMGILASPKTRWRGAEQPLPTRRMPSIRGPAKQQKTGLVSAAQNNAGWSSPVARQAHNLKAAGSNPAPATKSNRDVKSLKSAASGRFFCVLEPAADLPHTEIARISARSPRT